MQIGVAAGSIVLAFGKDGNNHPGWWTWTGIGAVLLLSGTAMMRIGSGIKANAQVLSTAGKILGDIDIPVPKFRWGGVSFFISLSMLLAGMISIYLALAPFLWQGVEKCTTSL